MTRWHDVCGMAEIDPDRGVCALVEGAQVAIFRLSVSDEMHAVSNHDPFSGASVLSRGIVGTSADAPVVTSPVFKNKFDLRTGVSLDDPAVALAVYDVRVVGDRVEVGIP